MKRRIDYDEFVATFAYDKIVDLSASSVALILSAVTEVHRRYRWSRNGADLNDTDWNFIDNVIGTAQGEIMSSMVGWIMPHAMATVSVFKAIPCDGGVYNRTDYPLLYDALDPAYIVSGAQFRVPDMRDRVPVGTGNNYALDDSGGVDSVVLTEAQLPAHQHSYNQYTFGIDIESVGVPDPTGVGQPTVPQNTSSVGSDEAHENRMPYRALNWVIIAG